MAKFYIAREELEKRLFRFIFSDDLLKMAKKIDLFQGRQAF